jgi:para-nitrobenzyl esterase
MRASSLAAALLAAAAALTVSACGPSATEGTSASTTAAGEPPAAATSTAIAEPIRLDAGLLAGGTSSSANVRVYRGIPFAAPPVGELRWAAPQPVAEWDGTRDASEFGNICIQPPGPTEGPQARLNIAVLPDSPPMTEDCLYLNVWTGAAAATERRPVMVYFFGGAFTEGSGSVPLYDGDALAQKGAVVVTMNYRLGPYGFFVHPALTSDSPHKASGNYGLMDMLASLRWVKSNIAAFGGDPGNVTVFGQSAGAMAIASLVASPEAAGLFHRAISQSGAWMGLGMSPGMRTRAQAEEVGLTAANDAGVATVEQLRAMSTDDVTAKFRSAGMIVDGWIIPEDPSTTFAANRQNPVDVLAGSNKEESFFRADVTPVQFEERARMRWGDLADEYLALYPHATDAEAANSVAQDFSDGAFWHMRLFADYQAKRGNKAWLFYFAQNPPSPAGEPPRPATHASEVPYVFNNLGELPLFPDRSVAELAKASAPDQKVADKMSSYWVNFARTGDPNGAGLPAWQPHQLLASERATIFDADPASERTPDPARLALLDKLYERVRAQHAVH